MQAKLLRGLKIWGINARAKGNMRLLLRLMIVSVRIPHIRIVIGTVNSGIIMYGINIGSWTDVDEKLP